jgi:MFS family permease
MKLLKEKRIILIVASLAAFLVPYTVSSMAVALPAIGSRFSLDTVMLGWVMSAYMFTAAICIVPLGRVAIIFGRKRLFLLGMMLFIYSDKSFSFYQTKHPSNLRNEPTR